MSKDETRANLSYHLRTRIASVALRVAASILWLARRLYRAGLLTFADIKLALRLSEAIRGLAWRLLGWKRH
jgi:hypothetical protein